MSLLRWPKWLGGRGAPPKTQSHEPPPGPPPEKPKTVTPKGKPDGKFRPEDITDSLFGG
jgi:hypothetical protein